MDDLQRLLTSLKKIGAPEPAIGLDDYDGTPNLSWASDGLFGSLSLFDDGTYSYYVEKDGRSSQGSLSASQPIPRDLARLLRQETRHD